MNPGNAMIGAMAVGLVYGIVSLLIYKTGYKWIMKILPAVVVGPVIMVIGLGLAGVAVDMAMNISVEQVNSDTGQTELVKQYSGWHFSAKISDFICADIFQRVL